MLSLFYRSSYSQIVIKLSSDETLGILDSGYLEDYGGNNGRVTLHHEPTGVKYPLLMAELPSETPATEHDVFEGRFLLTGKPNGRYWIQGRVRDIAGNYTILGAIANPVGNERVLSLGIELLDNYAPVIIPRVTTTYRQQVTCRATASVVATYG
jgi:hypothetical protein